MTNGPNKRKIKENGSKMDQRKARPVHPNIL